MERELWVIDICRYISICMYIFYTNCTILLYYYTVCMVWASKLNVVCFFAYAILVATLHNSVFECVCDRMYVYMYIHVRYVVVIVLVHIVYAYALYGWSEWSDSCEWNEVGPQCHAMFVCNVHAYVMCVCVLGHICDVCSVCIRAHLVVCCCLYYLPWL